MGAKGRVTVYIVREGCGLMRARSIRRAVAQLRFPYCVHPTTASLSMRACRKIFYWIHEVCEVVYESAPTKRSVRQISQFSEKIRVYERIKIAREQREASVRVLFAIMLVSESQYNAGCSRSSA